MRPLAQRALNQLEGRVRMHRPDLSPGAESMHAMLDEISEGRGYDICFDGSGMALRLPCAILPVS